MNYVIEQINNQCVSHYNHRKYSFDYIKPDDFETLQQNNSTINVVGWFKLKSTKEKDNIPMVELLVDNKKYFFKLHEADSSEDVEKKKGIIGYVYVGQNNYIAVLKSFFFLLLLIPVFILALLVLLYPKQQNKSLETEPGIDPSSNTTQQEELPMINENIKIPLYEDRTFSSDNAIMQLVNPKDNTVYFVYELIEDGEEIYKSKAFEPGKAVEADLSLLGKGIHQIQINIYTYDLETEQICNGASENICIELY